MENKRLAGAAGMIFWSYTGVVVSYFFAMSYLSGVFISVFNNDISLSNLLALAPFVTDIQHTAVLIAGLILTVSLALRPSGSSKASKVLKFIPFVLFVIPGLDFFLYINCRYQIFGTCSSQDAIIGMYVGSLLILALLIGQLLIRTAIPVNAYKFALAPLAVVVIGSLYSMYFSAVWGSAALKLDNILVEDLFTLGNFSKLPGDWRVWIQTGITLQIIFGCLALLGLVLCILSLAVKSQTKTETKSTKLASRKKR